MQSAAMDRSSFLRPCAQRCRTAWLLKHRREFANRVSACIATDMWHRSRSHSRSTQGLLYQMRPAGASTNPWQKSAKKDRAPLARSAHCVFAKPNSTHDSAAADAEILAALGPDLGPDASTGTTGHALE